MADGGQAERRKSRFTAIQEAHLERAARKIALAHGYGSGWKAETIEMPSSENWQAGSPSLGITHLGGISEQAAHGVSGGVHVRRQRAWVTHAGVVSVPSASPDHLHLAALDFADLSGPLMPLLLAYSLESMSHWLTVESYIHPPRPSQRQIMAGRDAMARIMYAKAAMPITSRSLELHVRASDYRKETRALELLLSRWLLLAATRYNKAADASTVRVGSYRANGFKADTLWKPPKHPAPILYRPGTFLFPANGINCRDEGAAPPDSLHQIAA